MAPSVIVLIPLVSVLAAAQEKVSDSISGSNYGQQMECAKSKIPQNLTWVFKMNSKKFQLLPLQNPHSM